MKKVLWLTNMPLPEASLLLDSESFPYGGWMVNLSKYLSKIEEFELHLSFPYSYSTKVKSDSSKIYYHSFTNVKKHNDKVVFDYEFSEIIKRIKPDMVHIFGTEYYHSYLAVNLCNNNGIRTLIQLQGLTSIYAKHYFAGLLEKYKYRTSIRDLIKADNLFQQKKKFEESGRYEILTIENSKNFVGYTSWDETCIFQLNPNANYFRFNDILREEFYKHQWNFERCKKYSIFVSQGQYPIKGLHFVIEALNLILKEFPCTKLYVGGLDITKSNSKFGWFFRSTYANLLIRRIKKLSLQKHVIFTGQLNEVDMCKRFISSHVCVSPSSIENTSFSLLEAKYLGVPCVASYVGGVVDLIDHGKDGFYYQHDAPYMLASFVMKIFRSNELANQLSENSRMKAIEKHNPDRNSSGLIEIYNGIINN